MSAIILYKDCFSCFLAYQYVLHCVYSGVSVDCFNKDYHHHHHHHHHHRTDVAAEADVE